MTRQHVCGWDEKEAEHAEKLVGREAERLKESFESAISDGYRKFIMFLHYPPTNVLQNKKKLGLLGSMKKVMFGDRLFNRVKQTEFVVFERTSRENEARETNWHSNLKKAYEKCKTLFSLEDRYFTAVSNSETGEVSDQTIFSYHQKENVIWAEYSGGSIIKGFLLGTIDDNNNLHFDYRHINTEGELKSGECHSEPRFENGKLRFYEKWKWTSGCEGTSVIEEL